MATHQTTPTRVTTATLRRGKAPTDAEIAESLRQEVEKLRLEAARILDRIRLFESAIAILTEKRND